MTGDSFARLMNSAIDDTVLRLSFAVAMRLASAPLYAIAFTVVSFVIAKGAEYTVDAFVGSEASLV